MAGFYLVAQVLPITSTAMSSRQMEQPQDALKGAVIHIQSLRNTRRKRALSLLLHSETASPLQSALLYPVHDRGCQGFKEEPKTFSGSAYFFF